MTTRTAPTDPARTTGAMLPRGLAAALGGAGVGEGPVGPLDGEGLGSELGTAEGAPPTDAEGAELAGGIVAGGGVLVGGRMLP